jgi:hypothetical protein
MRRRVSSGRYAAFVHHMGWGGNGTVGFTRGRFIGHVLAADADQARAKARAQYPVLMRSCDRVSVKRDGGRRQWYGVRGAGSPGGVGLL